MKGWNYEQTCAVAAPRQEGIDVPERLLMKLVHMKKQSNDHQFQSAMSSPRGNERSGRASSSTLIQTTNGIDSTVFLEKCEEKRERSGGGFIQGYRADGSLLSFK